MKNNKTVWIMILVFVLLIGGAYVLYDKLGSQMDMPQLATQGGQTQDETSDNQNDTGDSEDEAQNALAPDFTVYDREGNPYKLSDFLGKPVVLNFWASWCGPCKMEMPDFQLAYEEYGENIHFLFVNLTNGYNETLETATDFIDESGYTFPVYYDTDVDATMTYGVYSVPVTYFIDAEGYLIANGMGALDLKTIKRGISMIYEED